MLGMLAIPCTEDGRFEGMVLTPGGTDIPGGS